MRFKILAGMMLVLSPSVAMGHAKPPKALHKIETIKRIYPKKFKKEVSSKNPSWDHLRKVAKVKWFQAHPYSNATIYNYFGRTHDTYGAIQKVYEQKKTPSYIRIIFNCIFKHESGFVYNIWYHSSRGWQGGRFAGTDTVNGSAQLRPFWASLFLGDCTDCANDSRYNRVTTRTYKITSDPIASTKIALRIGLDPFYADKGVCGF